MPGSGNSLQMWQRFTERARKSVFYAQEEAQQSGIGKVSTEHLLLGILREPDSTATTVLDELGVDLVAIRDEVVKQLERGVVSPARDMTLTPRAKRVIDLAYDEARRLGNNFIGTEHLLLGLISEGDGRAGRTLAKFDVELPKARLAIQEIQGNPSTEPAESEGWDQPPSRKPFRSYHVETLPVRFDLQTLTPVDQVLLSILCDRKSSFSIDLRKNAPGFEHSIPAVIAVMAKAAHSDPNSLEQILDSAQVQAAELGRTSIEVQDLYLVCLRATSDEVRQVLDALNMNPFPQERS